MSNGLPNLSIYSITVSSSNYVFVGTLGAGVYRTINPITSVKNNHDLSPAAFSLSQNYPNPFNPVTVISYQLPVTGNVTLKIYDILGKEVATLVNEEKPAGYYNVKFNGSSLSSGVYFYRLQVGSFVETRKLILMK